MFGSILMSEILTTTTQIGDAQNNNYGDTLLQTSGDAFLFINGPIEDNIIKSFISGLTTMQTTENLTKKQLEEIRKTPTTEFTPLSVKFMESHSPQLSPNGQILTFVAKNHWGKDSVKY